VVFDLVFAGRDGPSAPLVGDFDRAVHEQRDKVVLPGSTMVAADDR
jgi:hypothetical protein